MRNDDVNLLQSLNRLKGVVGTNRSLTDECVKQGRKLAFVRVHNQPHLYNVLFDTGADFSVINCDIVSDLNLSVKPPTGYRFIVLADKSTVERIGSVDIVFDVLFPCSDIPFVSRMKKEFEVLATSHDFIFGNDMLPRLFRGDQIMDYVKTSRFFDGPIILQDHHPFTTAHLHYDHDDYNDRPRSYTDQVNIVLPNKEVPDSPLTPSMFSKKYKTAIRHGQSTPHIPTPAAMSKPRLMQSTYTATVNKSLAEMETDLDAYHVSSNGMSLTQAGDNSSEEQAETLSIEVDNPDYMRVETDGLGTRHILTGDELLEPSSLAQYHMQRVQEGALQNFSPIEELREELPVEENNSSDDV